MQIQFGAIRHSRIRKGKAFIPSPPKPAPPAAPVNSAFSKMHSPDPKHSFFGESPMARFYREQGEAVLRLHGFNV